MNRTVPLLGLLASLCACGDGQPFFDDGSGGSGSGGGADNSLTRFEPESESGGGFVQDVRFDPATDTFFVDNLAFDGDNVYARDDQVPLLSDPDSPTLYRVFEGDEIERDPTDGDPVRQFAYRAIYGESVNRTADGEPVTSFAIVRTGSFVDYGFGGFVYARNGGVDLPTTGQAVYSGDYAGVRIFNGRSGLEYTTGEAEIAIDFRDFNEGEGVRGVISDRRAFDINGNPIATGTGENDLKLPNLIFDVGPGTINESGEMTNEIRSTLLGDSGQLEEYEAGTYLAIVAGDNASEIVGIVVVESDDPRFEGVTAQETGGFIVYR